MDIAIIWHYPDLNLSMFLFFAFCTAFGITIPCKSVRFAVLSDIHVALSESIADTGMAKKGVLILEIAIREINNRGDVDFTVVIGDVVNVPLAHDVHRIYDLLEELIMPYYIIIGNHDILQPEDVSNQESNNPLLSKTDFARLFREHGFSDKESYWWGTEPVQNLHIVGLDSGFAGDWGGKISKQQIAWLKHDLAYHQTKQTVIFVHHGLVNYWKGFEFDPRYNVENSDEVRSLLESFTNVKVVISGHYHISGYKLHNGIHYFVSPALLIYPCAYGIITISPESLTYEIIQISDMELIRMARNEKHGLENSVPDEKKEAWIEMIEGFRKISVLLA